MTERIEIVYQIGASARVKITRSRRASRLPVMRLQRRGRWGWRTLHTTRMTGAGSVRWTAERWLAAYEQDPTTFK